MPIVLVVLGVLLVAVANYDALVTTIAVGSGSRPLTAHVAEGLRKVLRRVRPLMSAGGPIVVLATVGVWIGLLWAGYSLIFFGDSDAVTTATTGEAAGAVSRIYYAGYTLFTLGNGGYAPAVGLWEIVTVVATLNGLFVVTLSITYLVPVVSAVVERRQLASFIHALGDSAEEVVISAWNGTDFSYLESQLPTAAQTILLTAQRHLAYPVLHDFRSSDTSSASERTLAMLDDAVTLLDSGVDSTVRLSPPVVRTVRFAIDEARRLMPIDSSTTEAPPAPDLQILASAGVPVGSQRDFDAAVAANADRRRHLAALIEAAARQWPNRAGIAEGTARRGRT